MKLALPGALHARPASLLVRLVSRHTARLELWKGPACADARKIMDLLSLGAAKGDEVELRAEGDDATALLEAVAALIARNFDSDLVPELGSAAVEGIALGRALVVARAGGARRSERLLDDGAASGPELPHVREERRVRVALTQASHHLTTLIAALPEEEARLFEPEEAILREVEAKVLAAVRAGASAEDAVYAATEPAVSDLLLDARARVLDVLAGEDLFGRIGVVHDPDDDSEEFEAVLVTAQLTPTLVARLPEYVQGIVAARPASDDAANPGAEGRSNTYASHAAILARARSLPLAIVPPQVALAIAEGDTVLIDTTASPARVWVAPSEALVAEARSRQDSLARTSYEAEQVAARTPLGVPIDLLVNIGTARERVPAGASGVGLLRTELLFAGRLLPPSVREQARLLATVFRGAGGGLVTVRLFDAADDKPLAWLPADEGARGIGLLLRHPEVLAGQLEAILKGAEVAWRGASADPPHRAGRVQVLLPYTRSPDELHAVRERLGNESLHGMKVAVGAMIESPDAVGAIDSLAAASDFVCIGTNDLAAALAGTSRIAPSRLDATLVRLVGQVVERAHHHGRTVTVCGELAANAHAAQVFVGLGVDALSVAPSRLAQTRLALRDATPAACRAAAHDALHAG